jgi:hypothetical protein
VTTYEIRGGQSGTGTGLTPSFFDFAILITIPQLLHTHLSPFPEVCDARDQAAPYHIFCL